MWLRDFEAVDDTVQEIEASANRMCRVTLGALVVSGLAVGVILHLTMPWTGVPRAASVGLPVLLIWSFLLTTYSAHCMYKTLGTAVERMRNIAVVDDITDLYNRRYMMKRLKEEAARCQRYSDAVSVVQMSVTGLENVNAEYGRHMGDTVLKEIAEILKGDLRDCDIIGRLDGPRFLAILPKTRPQNASIPAKRLVKRVSDYNADLGTQGQIDSLRLYAGVAAFPVNGGSIRDVLEAAAEAMAEAEKHENGSVETSQNYVTSRTVSISESREMDEEEALFSAVRGRPQGQEG